MEFCPSSVDVVLLLLPCSHPGYFGKVGMRWFHKKPNTSYCKTINVEMLWSLVSEAIYDQAKASAKGADVPVINCVQKVRCHGNRVFLFPPVTSPMTTMHRTASVTTPRLGFLTATTKHYHF